MNTLKIMHSLIHWIISIAEFHGYVIPKDTTILLNGYHVMHDAKVWERPYEFYPEHFLDSDGSFRNRDGFCAFGTGVIQYYVKLIITLKFVAVSLLCFEIKFIIGL